MPKIRVLIVLLAAMLIAPVTLFAAPSEKAAAQTTDSVRDARQALVLADGHAGKKGKDEQDGDEPADDDEGGRTHIYKEKGADKKRVKDEARRARDEVRDQRNRNREDLRGERDEARSEEMAAYNKRMQEAETVEEPNALKAEKKAARAHRADQDREIIMPGERRAEHSSEMDEYGKRMQEAETVEERSALKEKMKAARSERDEQNGERHEMILDHQEKQKVVRDERRAVSAQAKDAYNGRLEAADSAEERQAIQEEMQTASAEQQTERVEQQKEKKPWWRFWDD